MLKTKIADCLKRAVKESIPIEIFIPDNEKFGHYSTNVALRLAKTEKRNPMGIASRIKQEIRNSKFFDKVEVAAPGFINFWLTPKIFQDEIKEILKKKDKYGVLPFQQSLGKKINIEFISANPTGPLTIGNGRGGFGGDVLANILEKIGYNVTREYYINDRGKQIENLKKGLYEGEKRTVFQIQKENQKVIVKKLKIKFDVWFSEKSLYKNKEVDAILNFLKKKKLTYEKDGALWFKSTKFGDDKDRVLIKADGEKTYFASDVAYLKNKFEREFDKIIIFLGADHHGYIKRMEAAAAALGYQKEKLFFIIVQLVRLLKNGKETKMSKREGSYITINELINEVGLGAARFFFLMSSPETHMNFDLALAKEKSLKNPVYYVQYAAVRCQNILKKSETRSTKSETNFELLNTLEDINLMRILARFPEIIEEAANNYNPQILVRYALNLAKEFHNFYEKERIIGEKEELVPARLELIKAVQIIFKNLFNLLGIKLLSKM
jgi:arginyl-tRNA synthetase